MSSPVLPAFDVQARRAGPLTEEASVPEAWSGTLVPNFSQWKPGDIVLVAGDGSLGALIIETGQALSRQRLVREAARFTHAAIYVGGGMLVDVVPRDGAGRRGVGRRSVWYYCHYRDLIVRRLPSSSGGIAEADIAAIADAASRHVGEDYDLSAAIFSKLIPSTEPEPGRLYCSTFVGLVITEATGLRLTERPEHRPLHPATLATHPALETVAVEWCQLGRARAHV